MSKPVTCRIRLACAICLFALSGVEAGAADAENYPTRAVRLVVPYPIGTGTDTVARVIAQSLSEQLGKSIVVDNRPGGGTVIGMDLVAKARADGYTLLAATTSLVITPGLMPRLPFDPVNDFAPIVLLDTAPLLLVANAARNVKNVRELVAMARAMPGQLNYASSGNGGAIHLGMELLKFMTGTNITHIPYKGSPAALLAVLAGAVDVGINTFSPSVISHVASGKLVALGVTGLSRSPVLPQVPTVAESGIPGYEVVSWHGLLAPAGTPASIVKRIETEAGKVLEAPNVRAMLSAQGFQIENRGPAPFAAFISREITKWTQVVKASGARVD